MRTIQIALIAALTMVSAVNAELNQYLSDKLTRVEKSAIQKVESPTAPQKFYAFYETASWCGPCQAFTPTLVRFYEVYKEIYGDQFELVVLSYDRSDEKMIKYATEKKMSFPHLDRSQVSAFETAYPITGQNLPNLIITDVKGRPLKSAYDSKGNYVGPEVAMNFLKTQLEKK